MLVQGDLDEGGRSIANQSITLLIIRELKQFLAKVVAKGI